MTNDDINSYVDQKNSLMLAILGLHETLDLFASGTENKYWVDFNILGDAQFCFYNCGDLYKWPIKQLLENDGVLSILSWCGGVLDYVD